MQWSKDSVLNKWYWNNEPSSSHKSMNSDTDFALFTKICSKWIIDLYVKCKTIKLLEDNTGKNLDNLGYCNDFLEVTPKVWFMKKVMGKLNFI